MTRTRESSLASARRFSWAIADQVLSSATNFALGFLVARAVSIDEFGAFSLAFATYTLALAGSRALSTEPLMVRYGFVSREESNRGIVSATGTATAVGIAVGAGCIVVALIATGPLASSFLALGLTMPGLLLQDSWRYAFFSSERGKSAFANDLVWAVLLLPGILILYLIGFDSVGWMIFVWGASATVAGLAGLLQSHLVPRPLDTRRWLREQRDLAPRFLGEFAVSSATTQLTLYGVSLIAGLRTAAALRAAQLLLGPVNVLFLGSGLVIVPEAVKTLKTAPDKFLRWTIWLSAALAALALLWATVAFLIPDSIGVELLGDSWEEGRSILVPMGLSVAAFGLLVGPMTALRALEAAGRSLTARAWTSLLGIVGSLVGAAVAAARGVAWASAAAAFLAIGIYWQQLLAALRHRRAQNWNQEHHEPDTAD